MKAINPDDQRRIEGSGPKREWGKWRAARDKAIAKPRRIKLAKRDEPQPA